MRREYTANKKILCVKENILALNELDCQSIKLFINTDLSDTEKCNGRSCFYCLKFILCSHTATKLSVALHECLCYNTAT